MTTGGFDLGGLDIGALLAQAQSVQNQLEAAQNQLAESNFEGTAGGGLVRATVTGTGELDAAVLRTSPISCPEDSCVELVWLKLW